MCELIAEKGSLMLDSIFISILIKIRGFRIQRERKERQREKKTFFAVDKINVLCVFLLPSGCLLPSSNSSFPQVLVLRYVVIKASSMTVL